MNGTLARLWRYPVKSMLGEECDRLQLDNRGVAGDRLFAIRDSNGKLGSGKNTRRFRHIDGLFRFQANYDEAQPVIRFPDGRTMRADDPETNNALSQILGQPVTIARETDLSHLDAGPVHILTTDSLAWLQTLLPDSQIDERRFRPNIVIDTPGTMQIENLWMGKTLVIGDTVRLRVNSLTERCAMTTFAQADLPADGGIFGHIAEHAAMQFGLYAAVLTPGWIHRGDSVIVSGRP